MKVYFVKRNIKTDKIIKEEITSLEELFDRLNELKEEKEKGKDNIFILQSNISFEDDEGNVLRRLFLPR